jgi:hypothetical protein
MTEFSETRALLIALEEGESDRLSEYLTENFYPNELEKLARACRAVSWTASDVRSEVERRFRAAQVSQSRGGS